jgi:hypothetical protein
MHHSAQRVDNASWAVTHGVSPPTAKPRTSAGAHGPVPERLGGIIGAQHAAKDRTATAPAAHAEPTFDFLNRIAGDYWEHPRQLLQTWADRIARNCQELWIGVSWADHRR